MFRGCWLGVSKRQDPHITSGADTGMCSQYLMRDINLQCSQHSSFSDFSEDKKQSACKTHGSYPGLSRRPETEPRNVHLTSSVLFSASARLEKQCCEHHHTCNADTWTRQIRHSQAKNHLPFYLWMPAADTQLPETYADDTFVREARGASEMQSACSTLVWLHAKNREPAMGTPPAPTATSFSYPHAGAV